MPKSCASSDTLVTGGLSALLRGGWPVGGGGEGGGIRGVGDGVVSRSGVRVTVFVAPGAGLLTLLRGRRTGPPRPAGFTVGGDSSLSNN